jgi:uncharacterized membrane protein YidH (DUF202 family)
MNSIVNNSESIARDNLANERTFLSWIRTSFTLIALGIVILRTDVDNLINKIISLCVTATALLFLIFGIYRYFNVNYWIYKDKYPSAFYNIIVISILSLIIIILLLVLIFIKK